MTPALLPVGATVPVAEPAPVLATTDPSAASASPATGTFARLMDQQIGSLDADVGAAQTAMSDLAAGRPVELHDVMISLERARISVQAFVQIRNRLVESYQDLMRMQM